MGGAEKFDDSSVGEGKTCRPVPESHGIERETPGDDTGLELYGSVRSISRSVEDIFEVTYVKDGVRRSSPTLLVETK
jgi:hypothetical protein